MNLEHIRLSERMPDTKEHIMYDFFYINYPG